MLVGYSKDFPDIWFGQNFLQNIVIGLTQIESNKKR
jgi:hypothetical protein